MANYTSLKIYKSLTDFAKSLSPSLEKIRQPYKYEYGKEMRNLLVELLVQVAIVNSSNNAEKIKQLTTFAQLVRKLQIYIQLCVELGLLSFKGKYSIGCSINILKDIQSQMNKWRTYLKRNQKEETSEIDTPRKAKLLIEDLFEE